MSFEADHFCGIWVDSGEKRKIRPEISDPRCGKGSPAVNSFTYAKGDLMSRRIRMVQLVHGYPPAVGGVELSVRDLCERLVRDYDFDVTVLTTNAYTVDNFFDPTLPLIPIQEGEVQSGVQVRRFKAVTHWRTLLWPLQSIAWRFRIPGNDLLRTWYHGPICPGMLRTLRGTEADVICAASFPLNHMRYPFMLGRNSPPVVLLPSTHTNQPWGFDRPNLIRLVNRSYATIAHTAHEREWLLMRGAKPEKIRVIGHGISKDELRPRAGAFRSAHGIRPDAFLVAYIGQQGAHKGLDTLISVFPELLRSCPSAWLAIGGASTPYSVELRRLVSLLPKGGSARIIFQDNLTVQQKADLLGDCDVFASPSGAESFGITTLEAWSLKKPVIVGDSPAQREIVENGRTGIVVKYGNKSELLSALVKLEKDPNLRIILARNGHDKQLEEYDRNTIECKYADTLREAALNSGIRDSAA